MAISGFVDRLKVAISGESVNSFAKKCNVRESLLRKYLSGISLPGMGKLVAIARTANVRIDWLATGEGEMINNINAEKAKEVRESFVRGILEDKNSVQLLTTLRAYMLFTRKSCDEMDDNDISDIATIHRYFIESGNAEILTIPTVRFYLACLETLSMKLHMGQEVTDDELLSVAHDVFHDRWNIPKSAL